MQTLLVSLFRRVTGFLWSLWFTGPPIAMRSKATDQIDADGPSMTFDEATATARELKPTVSTRLRLYGLYKQSTVGDAPETEPKGGGMLDAAAPLKWRSWVRLRGIQQEAAKQMYVQLVQAAVRGDDVSTAGADVDASPEADGATAGETLDGVPLEALDDALNGFAGPVMSSMSVSAEDVAALAQADRDSPLHGFARQGDVRSVRYLLGKGEAVDARDEDAHTALHWASDGGHLEVAKALLEGGASVDVRNCDGSTPLHMACACEHAEIVQLLLDAGASASLVDDDGCTPRALAPPAVLEQVPGL